MQQTDGFTIIEVLLAIALLTVIVMVVMSGLTGSFRLSGNSTLQSVATNRSQAVIESIRGQWQTVSQYNSACVQLPTVSGITTTISVQDENVDGSSVGSPYSPTISSNCSSVAALANIRPLRRVTVTSTNTSGSNIGQSKLTVEIAGP